MVQNQLTIITTVNSAAATENSREAASAFRYQRAKYSAVLAQLYYAYLSFIVTHIKIRVHKQYVLWFEVCMSQSVAV